MILKYYHSKLVISDQKLKDIFPADTQFYQIRKKIKEVFFSSLTKMELLSHCVCEHKPVNSQLKMQQVHVRNLEEDASPRTEDA